MLAVGMNEEFHLQKQPAIAAPQNWCYGKNVVKALFNEARDTTSNFLQGFLQIIPISHFRNHHCMTVQYSE